MRGPVQNQSSESEVNAMPKILSCLFMAAAISSVCLPIASKADDTVSGTGNELITECNDKNSQAVSLLWEYCIGFVNGVAEGVNFAGLYIMTLENNKITAKQLVNGMNSAFRFCLPYNITRGQQALVVSKYLHDHPEILNQDSMTLVINAFQNAWPCPKSTK